MKFTIYHPGGKVTIERASYADAKAAAYAFGFRSFIIE